MPTTFIRRSKIMTKRLKALIVFFAWFLILICALVMMISACIPSEGLSRVLVFIMSALIIGSAFLVFIFDPATFTKAHTTASGD